MIVPDSKAQTLPSDIKDPNALDDAPPEYTPSQTDSSNTTGAGPSSFQLPTDAQRTNFLLLSRGNNSIKGTWIIDPALTIPHALLPPLEEGETRQNAKLESTHGSISGSIWVASSSPTADDTARPATLYFKSQYGSLKLKVLRTDDRQSLSITAFAGFGSINLTIPHTFRGPVTLTTAYGSIKSSSAVSAKMTTFSETHGTRRAFIGEHTEWMKDPDAWKRDTLVIEAQYGSIRLNFASDDAQRENEDGIEKGVGGFFSKLFGGK